ncbi:MAG: methionyl-tRNA formyltransferase [Candidatus Omnitrophica bacterium]|nr:methionyl-tRNA formyltransferase [Candidatus Omnitrophota bacterium]
MKIVFFGSSDFSLASLKALRQKHQLLAVYTQPDRKKGRNLLLSKTPVKIYAEEYNLPIFQPEIVSAPEIVEQLKSFNADLFVVVSFGQKLSNQLLEIPREFCLNVHSSLLPKWRGAAPINYAIINGDKLSGVTIMKMNETMDGGDIVLSKSLEINDDDAVVLLDKLAVLGAEALLESIDLIEKNQEKFVPQDQSKVSVAKKLKKENGLIDWRDSADCIHNKVRGLLPWPCAFTHYKGKLLKILKTKVLAFDRLENTAQIPGEIVQIEKHAGIVVMTGSQALLIESLQLEGKKAMNAYDFVNGHNLKGGDIFGN